MLKSLYNSHNRSRSAEIAIMNKHERGKLSRPSQTAKKRDLKTCFSTGSLALVHVKISLTKLGGESDEFKPKNFDFDAVAGCVWRL